MLHNYEIKNKQFFTAEAACFYKEIQEAKTAETFVEVFEKYIEVLEIYENFPMLMSCIESDYLEIETFDMDGGWDGFIYAIESEELCFDGIKKSTLKNIHYFDVIQAIKGDVYFDPDEVHEKVDLTLLKGCETYNV